MKLARPIGRGGKNAVRGSSRTSPWPWLVRLGGLTTTALALLLGGPLTVGGASEHTLTVEIRDWQDGRDYLIVQGSNLRWQHWDYNVPGVEAGHNDPTFITTTIQGKLALSNRAWYPQWPEGTGAGAYSSTLTALWPGWVVGPTMSCRLEVIAARNTVQLIQTPAEENDYTTVVELDDNSDGSADWYDVRLIYDVSPKTPVIVTPPTSLTVGPGCPAEFAVEALAVPAPRYQWFRNGTNAIRGATNSSLEWVNVQASQEAVYTVVISNVYGAVTSPPAVLAVKATPPVIQSQPASETIPVGGTAEFTVTVERTCPEVNYQWWYQGQPLAGATQATLRLAHVGPSQAGGYGVVATDAFGSVTSLVAKLQLGTGPGLLANGDFEGGDKGFTTGYKAVNSLGAEGSYGVVATPRELTPHSAAIGDHTTGRGKMLALNGSLEPGTVVWSETVTVAPYSTYLLFGWATTWGNARGGDDPSPPVLRILINGQPAGADVPVLPATGQWQCFSVTWDSDLALSTLIEIHDLNTTSVGNDFALDDLQLTPLGPSLPAITRGPQSRTAEAGTTIHFGVQAQPAATLKYEWFFNRTKPITGWLSGSNMYLTHLSSTQSGLYTVVVHNATGAVTSAPAALNVIAPVPRQWVPALNLLGQAGDSVALDYRQDLGTAAAWAPLGTVGLTNASQVYVDLSAAGSKQRFYRAREGGTPTVIPSLEPHLVPALILTGNLNDQLRVDYINQYGPTNAWVPLDTVTLSQSPQLYFDLSSIGQPARLWRVVPVK
jgi:hypothetical protein